MNKSEAEHLVINTFTHAFSEERFTQFVRNLLSDLQPASTRTVPNAQLPQGFRDTVHSYTRLGTYRDPQGDVLDVVVVNLKQQGSLDRARTRQRNLMAHYLNKRSKDAVLVAYITDDLEDWRFSFVKLAYQTEITDKGTVKVEKEFTPARRYSFLVGEHEPNHTAQKQLSDLLMSEGQLTITQIEDAFNIESVTKEFFEDYKSLFLHIKENLDQIVASNQKVKDEFDRCEFDTTNFAKKLLGQIVFLYFLQKKGWLGVGKDDIWGTGDKKFLSNLFEKNKDRNFFDDILEPFFYEALAIERIGDYYPALECKVPFLNGGLFEPLYGYDWKNIRIGLDNQVFEDVFQIFNRYNFTVREDEPLEKEVAVDPEMLGKVFENLLEVKDRKSKGAFYTPREIVHFMCQESLINYLDTALNSEEKKVDKGDIEIFIREGDLSIERDQAREQGKLNDDDYSLPECIRKHSKEIDFALADIKICDPAIGSGAFPVGMMTEIVRARNVLTPYLQNQPSRDAYNFKWHCIENSLYGVDNDSGAVEIAKLRLWLSLVVDEESYDHIRPLPNLDYRIVYGDSLLSVKKDMFYHQRLHEYERKKYQYYSSTNRRNKEVLREEMEEIRYEMTVGNTTFDFEIDFSEVFKENNGFDIVIGNPPYISAVNMKKLSKTYKSLFTTAYGSYDIYVLFFEKSIEILKTDGVLTLITSNKYLIADYAKKLRAFLLNYTTIQKLLDLADCRKVFENALISPAITILRKHVGSDYRINVALLKDNDISRINDLDYQELLSIDLSRDQQAPFDIHINKVSRAIIDKLINNETETLGNIGEVRTGVMGFEYWDMEPYITDEKRESTDSIRILTNSHIGKYGFLFGKQVKLYKKLFSNPYIDLSHAPINKNTKEFFKKQKIVIRGVAKKMTANLDMRGYALLVAVHGVVLSSPEFDKKYVLAILNSKLINWLHLATSYTARIPKGSLRYPVSFLKSIPIKRTSKKRQEMFIKLVNQILETQTLNQVDNVASDNDNIKELEREINQMIYELYGLQEEEILFIEENAGGE